jgi:chromosome segregation ATPase
MKSYAAVLAGLVAPSAALKAEMKVEAQSSLTFDLEAAKNRPVSKVITLLKDMLKQLEKEAEEDEEIYDQLACWCETNDKEKTKSIGDAESKIEQLTTAIEDLTAGSARLNTEIKNLEKEVAKNQEALDQATEIRQKELAEFNAEEKDLLGSISALKSAVTVLSKHNSASLLQIGSMGAITSGVQAAMQMHGDLLKGVFTHKQRRAVAAFLQSPQDYFDAEPTFKQSYAPQSGEIFGILKQMKETFEANLAQTQ